MSADLLAVHEHHFENTYQELHSFYKKIFEFLICFVWLLLFFSLYHMHGYLLLFICTFRDGNMVCSSEDMQDKNGMRSAPFTVIILSVVVGDQMRMRLGMVVRNYILYQDWNEQLIGLHIQLTKKMVNFANRFYAAVTHFNSKYLIFQKCHGQIAISIHAMTKNTIIVCIGTKNGDWYAVINSHHHFKLCSYF